jgi:signal transduction histidine kinase
MIDTNVFVSSANDLAAPAAHSIFTTRPYSSMALEAPSAGVEGALLAGVLISIVFFLALHWTQKKRAVYLGAMVYAAVETLRLWLSYDRQAILSSSLLDHMGIAPIMAIALSCCSVSWIAPRLLDLRTRAPVMANICVFHMILFGIVAVVSAMNIRFPLLDPVVVVWAGIFGVMLCAMGGWQALRGPMHVRMPAFCFCLAYLLTSLVLLLDIASRMIGAPPVDSLWLSAAISRLLLVCGAVMLMRLPRTEPLLGLAPSTDESALSRLQRGPLSDANLSSEQIERRLADTLTELASAVDMQRQINSMMSHELRMPVSTISAAAQSLEMILSGSGDLVDGRLARIRRSVSRITELLEQFLNQDRLSDQNFKVMREAIDLSQLATDVIASMQPDAGHSLMVDAPTPVIAWCDRPLSSVVLRNLVHNAIKYSPANQPVVIRTRLVNVNGQVTPTLSVIDRGPGIDMDEQARIFESQYRRASHLETKGMGIGLYLARRICQQQGGSLSVASTPGRGACFEMTLPALDQPPQS